MNLYTLHYGPFFFNIYADSDKDAVNKAQQALHSSSEGLHTKIALKVELTAGAFEGYVRFDPEYITEGNIVRKEEVEEEEAVPF